VSSGGKPDPGTPWGDVCKRWGRYAAFSSAAPHAWVITAEASTVRVR